MAAFDVLAALPWPILMALGGICVVALAFRARPDVFALFGFGAPEVTLLALGSVAGWVVNFPLVPLGSSFLVLNLGGALLSLFLAGVWLKRGHLAVVPALVGVGAVSVVSYFVVSFDPEAGIVSEFPWFFLPALSALGFGLVACRARWHRAVPLAYVSGSVGALLGADVYRIGELKAYFSQASEVAVISVGGAGIFDMVFLSGTLAMAGGVLVAMRLVPRASPAAGSEPASYPGRPFDVRDPATTWAAFARLDAPTNAERAVAALALAQAAMRDGDFARSVRMSALAVDNVLQAGTPALRDRLAELPEELRRDVAALAAAARDARAKGEAGRDVAGNALTAARYILGALLPRVPGRNRLVAA